MSIHHPQHWQQYYVLNARYNAGEQLVGNQKTFLRRFKAALNRGNDPTKIIVENMPWDKEVDLVKSTDTQTWTLLDYRSTLLSTRTENEPPSWDYLLDIA